MVSLAVLLAVDPPKPRPLTMDDFMLSIPRKPEDWRWEDVSATEIGRDLIAMLEANGTKPPYKIVLPEGRGVAVITPPVAEAVR